MLKLEQLGCSEPVVGMVMPAGYTFNACVDLAERMGGAYFGLFDLSEGAILRPVAEALRQPG